MILSITQKIWLAITCVLLALVAIFYFALHYNLQKGGIQEKLSDDEVEMVLSILGEVDADSSVEGYCSDYFKRSIALEYIFSKHHPLINFANGDVLSLLDILERMSYNEAAAWDEYYDRLSIISKRNCENVNEECVSEIENAFAKNEFLLKSFATLDDRTLKKMVGQLEISTSSYFWLNSKLLYLELLFWSVFGVLCNLLYWGTEHLRAGTFNRNEIPVHIAKLLYTRVCAIVIYFSFDNLTGDEYGKYHATIGTIVLSFMIGFFSGAAIDFLKRIKELILPSSSVKMETAHDDEIDKNTAAG